MGPSRLSTLGCTELESADGRSILSVLSQPKRFALLVYLAVSAPGGFVRRDRLVALFWPEYDRSRARGNLSKGLSFLRKSLGPGVVLTRGEEEVGVDPEALSCDVVALLDPRWAGATTWPDVGDARFLDGFHFDGARAEWDEWVERVAARCATAKVPGGSPAEDRRSTVSADGAPPSFAHGAVGAADGGRRLVTFWRAALPWGLAGALATVIALASRSPQPTGVDAYDWGFPPEAPMSFTGGSPDGVGHPAFSLSPGGDFLVYVGERGDRTELWYRSLENIGEAHPIQGTERAFFPMVSPDGEWVAFISDGQLRMVPIGGGRPIPLLEVAPAFGGAHWASMNQIVITDRDVRVRIVDPTTQQVTSEKRSRRMVCALPFLLPNGHVLCNNYGPYVARVLERDSSVARDLRQGSLRAYGSTLRLVSERYVTFVTADGALQIAPFDTETLQLGRPATVIPSVRREGVTGAAHYAVTSSGTLVYAPGDNAEEGRLVRRVGGEQPTALDVDPARFVTFDVSPGAERLAAVQVGVAGMELWIYDLQGGRSYRWLSSDALREPRWSPSGEKLAVRSFSDALARNVIMVGDPSFGPPSDTVDIDGIPHDFISDDRLLTGRGLLDISHTPPLMVDSIRTMGGALSPDRRWHAFASKTTGRAEVSVDQLPRGGQRFTIATVEGQEPVWTSSTEVAYRRGRTWYTVALAGDEPSEPQEWFTDDRFVDTPGRSHAPSRDGGVIYIQGTNQSSVSFLRVVPDWLEDAKRAADEANREPN